MSAERVTVDDEQVGIEPRAQAALAVASPQCRAATAVAEANALGDRNSAVQERGNGAGQDPVGLGRGDAGVGSGDERHAVSVQPGNHPRPGLDCLLAGSGRPARAPPPVGAAGEVRGPGPGWGTPPPAAARALEAHSGLAGAGLGETAAVLDAVDPGGEGLLDGREPVRVGSHRQPGGVRLVDHTRSSSRVNWQASTSVPGVVPPPLAITLTTSTRRWARSRTAARSWSAPATSPPMCQQ